MSFENLSKFGLNSTEKMGLMGGANKTNTASSPETTFLDQKVNPGCSDSQSSTDDDNGNTLSTCTTYTCPG
jgi:hypothetical protein